MNPEKKSTCRKIHPKYTHGKGEEIATAPSDRLYYCPDKGDVPNPMHGSEFQQHIKTCAPCQGRIFGNKDVKGKKT